MPPIPLLAADIPIFYPEVKEPYLTIFMDTVRGIESSVKLPVKGRVVNRDETPAQLQAWANQSKAPMAIVIGPNSLKTLQALPADAAILSAVFLTEPGNFNKVAVAVTYSPDPALLFSIMQRLDKRVKRVHVVINQTRWQWLLNVAESAAQSMNMQLVIHHAQNLSESAKKYDQVLKTMDPTIDSMWLPEDSSTMDTQVILPMVLKWLWDRDLKIFSSSVAHVGRGALFGLYPQNFEMGAYVGTLTQKIMNHQPIDEPIQPLRQVNSAINIRAMQHIGLDVDQQTLKTFTVVLPKDAR
jgi:putative ABC transport system substrate-binding protein